jgi:hypothetical protein
MKTRAKKTKKSTRRVSPLRAGSRKARTRAAKVKEPSLLDEIQRVTDELQQLRSRLANAGEDLPAIGTHRISALESELEELWERRRREQAAPLRATALTDEEEKVLAFPGGSRSRGS